ncbi:MAG: alpha/beta hydrolase [Candidatus Thermoplasmatota archaeon]
MHQAIMMKKIIFPILVSFVLMGVLLIGCTQQQSTLNTQETCAKECITLLSNGRYREAYNLFNSNVTTQISIAQLEYVWVSIIEQYGAFLGIVKTDTGTLLGHMFVDVTCNFSISGEINIRLFFDEHILIAGMQILPVQRAYEYTPPDYVDATAFYEINITIGSEEWVLPGTMTIPNGEGPYPGVVLVHGSGQNDRDETTGPNKPFKDIAWGLASNGIVVLRYEKRTKQYQQRFAEIRNYTVQDETIDDAIAAVDLLNVTSIVNHSQIFILGHSLGGMLAPRIAIQDQRIAGLILLAAPTRHIEDLFLDQMMYLTSLYSTIDENNTSISIIKNIVKKIKELNISDGEMVLGAPKSYWSDLQTYDPVVTAKSLDIPMLILQGKRDFQVTMVDFNMWNETFYGKTSVTLKSYDSLNHLFIPGIGKPTRIEYFIEGHIPNEVITDIASWIKNR